MAVPLAKIFIYYITINATPPYSTIFRLFNDFRDETFMKKQGWNSNDILETNVYLRPFPPFGPAKCVSVNVPPTIPLHDNYVSALFFSNTLKSLVLAHFLAMGTNKLHFDDTNDCRSPFET